MLNIRMRRKTAKPVHLRNAYSPDDKADSPRSRD
jgi:hypothetical protein